MRATKDLDVWIRPSESNARNVLRALSQFGARLRDLTEDDLRRKGTIFEIGLPPLRIDIITAIGGVEFADAWPDRLETLLERAGICDFSSPSNSKQENLSTYSGPC